MFPDSITVCRFRNVLVEADLYDTLLAEFNRQLEAKGIIVKRGAIIDASITNTPRRPRGRKSYEVVEDRKEDENIETSEKGYVGLSKTHAQHIMKSIAYNLYRTPGIMVSNCIR